MKITFLGSSHGVPSAERFCSSVMFETNGSIYLIDAGAPVIDLLLRQGKNVNDLKAVFTTHKHGDHVDGLLSLADLCNWYYKNTSFDIYVTEPCITETFSACITAMNRPVDTDRIRFKTAREGIVYDDGDVKVTYIPTRHCEPYPSYALLVEAEGKSVLFTGDLSKNLAKSDFPAIAGEVKTELVVCEMAHFGMDAVKPYMETLATKRLCFNHVYPFDKFDAIEMVAASGEYPYEISIAHDGDVFEL